MDENQKDTTPAQGAGPTPMMDIQPPKPMAAPEAAPTTDTPATPPSTPIAVSTPTDGPNLSEGTSDDTPASNTAAPAPMPGAHKRHVPVGVIVTAIIVALLLTGLTILAFMKGNSGTSGNNTPSAGQNDAAANKIKGSDVNKTSEQIDQEINSVNDEADFVTNELSDANLGL